MGWEGESEEWGGKREGKEWGGEREEKGEELSEECMDVHMWSTPVCTIAGLWSGEGVGWVGRPRGEVTAV